MFTLTVAPPHIRVWTLDGQRKLDADLGDHLLRSNFRSCRFPRTAISFQKR